MIDEQDQSNSQIGLRMNPPNPAHFIFSEERFEPCRVCGEPSSGWHCGAVTCEACKKFFLRSINDEYRKYKCVRNADCVIARATRTQCQYCRYQKCLEVGMTTAENPNNPTVAELFKAFPCSVCEAPSSGVHFGAITCEGCKGFFRRTVKERTPITYKCMDNGTCVVSVATRNMCRRCRYEKCLKAGMSSNNSRIGRQSNLFKHQIIELQRHGCIPDAAYLSSHKKNKAYKNMIRNDGMFNGQDDYASFLQQPQVQHDQLQYNMQATNGNYMYTQQQQHIKPEMQGIYTDSGYVQPQTQPNQIETHDMLNEFYNYTTNQQIEPQGPQTAIYDTQMPTVQQQHHQPSSYHPPLDSLFDKHTSDYIKQIVKLYLEFKADLLTFSMNDVYGYENDFDLVMEILRLNSVKFLKFAENLPDLLVLSIDDQNELIKNSIHSVILLVLQSNYNFLNYFNCEEQVFQKLVKYFPVFSRSHDFLRRLRDTFVSFKLDDVEYALYAALLIISPATHLTRFEKVSEIRERISDCLNKYMMARRNEDNTHDDLLLILTGLRKFNRLLQDGILDSYQKLVRKDVKAVRSLSHFSRVYLPKNAVF